MMRFRTKPRIGFVLLLFGLSGFASYLLADGADIYQTECVECHTLDGEGAGLGPALYGIVDQPAAQVNGFSYSDALLKKAANGLIWDAATLDQFLSAPDTVVPGTKMSYGGLTDETARVSLIAWLKELKTRPADAADLNAPAPSPEVEKILALAADPDYGEYLAAECATCHGNNASGGVPPIKGLPRPYFVQSLLDYKNGVRDNSVMKLMAGNLGDDELAALAAYFAKAD